RTRDTPPKRRVHLRPFRRFRKALSLRRTRIHRHSLRGHSRMSLELVNTAAAVGTFLVITTTAIAAVIQLRHLRASNQLQGLLTALARMEDDDFNTWFTVTQERLPVLLNDPTFRRRSEE